MGNTMAPSPRSYGDGEPYEVEFQSETKVQKHIKVMAAFTNVER